MIKKNRGYKIAIALLLILILVLGANAISAYKADIEAVKLHYQVMTDAFEEAVKNLDDSDMDDRAVLKDLAEDGYNNNLQCMYLAEYLPYMDKYYSDKLTDLLFTCYGASDFSDKELKQVVTDVRAAEEILSRGEFAEDTAQLLDDALENY